MVPTPLPAVELTEDEQEHLFALIHKSAHSARVITRAESLRSQSHWGQVSRFPFSKSAPWDGQMRHRGNERPDTRLL